MNVTVVYALPDRQVVRELELPEGSTLESALLLSGFLEDFPEIAGANPVGVHGQILPRHAVLHPGDRVEIYRPLRMEPKAARRKRAGQS